MCIYVTQNRAYVYFSNKVIFPVDLLDHKIIKGTGQWLLINYSATEDSSTIITRILFYSYNKSIYGLSTSPLLLRTKIPISMACKNLFIIIRLKFVLVIDHAFLKDRDQSLWIILMCFWFDVVHWREWSGGRRFGWQRVQ